jgi:hypothetical protein
MKTIRKIGARPALLAGAGVAVVALSATVVLAQGQPGGEAISPSYAIPNIVAFLMAVTLLAIPCRRLRRA